MTLRAIGWLMLGLVATFVTSCSEKPSIAAQNFASMQTVLDDAVAKNGGYGGGLCRVESTAGGLLFEAVAGETAAGSGTPMAPAQTFEIASITKTFTAAVVLLLAEEGKLSLDDPLRQLLPSALVGSLLVIGGREIGGDITVRQLMNHTSGLANYWDDPPFDANGTNAFLHDFMADRSRFWWPEEILDFVRQLDPISAPGGGFHYSDSNYILLGLIVETLTGKPLQQFYRERLFAPLGMADTYLSYREPAVSPHAESHRYEGTEDLYGAPRQSADWAGGGLVSSGRDLGRFVTALFEGAIFARAESLAAMTEWIPTGVDNISYGLGLYRINLAGGAGELVGHDGHGNSFMYYHPGRGTAMAGTLNQTENDWWPLAEVLVKADAQ